MTLVVSLRIPDGLVLAADSLSTVRGRIGIAADITATCPECKEKIKLPSLKMPPIRFPTSTLSFAQKLFPFHHEYGIASFGMGFLNKKSIYYHVKHLENITKNKDFNGVSTVAEKFKEYFDSEIRKQIKDINEAPDNFYPLGFLIVGYDKEVAITKEVNIGKISRIRDHLGIGCTVSGYKAVAVSLWKLSEKDPRQQAKYESFSLQDAVDYAEFLINITANYQRFANIIPTVGGDIDIALVTPYKKFTWIKCKKLMETLKF